MFNFKVTLILILTMAIIKIISCKIYYGIVILFVVYVIPECEVGNSIFTRCINKHVHLRYYYIIIYTHIREISGIFVIKELFLIYKTILLNPLRNTFT